MEFLFLLTGVIILFILWQRNRIVINSKERFSNNDITKLLNKLPNNCIVLHDIYIPKKNASYTRIEHIVINHNGVYVIDTKNYNGLIIGAENSEYWTQIVAKQKEFFYNPIFQNEKRMKQLQQYLGDALEGVPIHSIIVFGKHSLLKLDQPIKKAKVIKSSKLFRVLQQEAKDVYIYYQDRQYIYELLTYSEFEKSTKRRKEPFHRIIDFDKYRSRNNKSTM